MADATSARLQQGCQQMCVVRCTFLIADHGCASRVELLAHGKARTGVQTVLRRMTVGARPPQCNPRYEFPELIPAATDKTRFPFFCKENLCIPPPYNDIHKFMLLDTPVPCIEDRASGSVPSSKSLRASAMWHLERQKTALGHTHDHYQHIRENQKQLIQRSPDSFSPDLVFLPLRFTYNEQTLIHLTMLGATTMSTRGECVRVQGYKLNQNSARHMCRYGAVAPHVVTVA